jgi:pimeloyl-ACP methyl ester carboxylesterase
VTAAAPSPAGAARGGPGTRPPGARPSGIRPPRTRPPGAHPPADPGYNALPPDTDLTLPAGDEATITTDDGACLAVTVAGDPGATAPPVVLPHCWTGARAVNVPVARRLVAAGHRVVLYDQRGHGESTVGAEPTSVERLGDDLAAVVAGLDLRDAVLAGHSMGGMTVMALACRHPALVRDRVRGLALVATAAHGLAAAGRGRFWRVVLWRHHLNRLMVRPRLGRRFVRGTFGLDPLPAHVEATRCLFVATPPDVRRECAEAIGAMDLRTALRAVDVPAVVVLGERDLMIVNVLTRAIVEHLPGAELVELPDAGHMLPLERADDVAAAIRRLAR